MGKRRKVARFLAGTYLIAGSAGVAQAEVRSLSFINTHTQERASIVFKRDGSYDQNGLAELNRMLRDWRRNEVTRMDPSLFDLVWEVYRDSGARQPIHIVSGYRSPTTNNALRSRSRGVAKFSQHMLGKAMDFYLPDVELSHLREIGMKKQYGGVGFYPTSGSPFVHMDTGSVRAWPRMTREQLVRLFPDGKTAHLPADGNPLPGYQTALAEAESRKSRGGSTTSSSGGGLLAALFGGGSSSSSYSASSDEDEEGAAPAPRRVQELRQGPLPAASKTVVARSEETPPGVEGVPVYRSSPKPVQPQIRLAAVDVPQPAPERPAAALAAASLPTAAGKGSLLGLPMPQPSPRPVAAAGQPIPSRYGPNGDGLPPGWVRGPSGQPAGEAAAPFASQQIAALAAEPVRGAPLAVPIPMARPVSEQMVLAAAESLRGTPFAVPLPRPRPGGALRVAGRDGFDPFTSLTGERDEPTIALGYAPATAPETAGFATASLPGNARPAGAMQTASVGDVLRDPATIASRFAPPSSATAAAVARAAAQAGKTDRLAAMAAAAAASPLIAGKSDRASELKLYDGGQSVAGTGFAQMRHPDQQSLTSLLDKPGVTLATGFGSSIDDLAQRRFTGPAIVALAILTTR